MSGKPNRRLLLRRALAWILPLLVLVFCAWAAMHWFWARDLRSDLESQLGTLEDVRRLRGDLEWLRINGLDGDTQPGTLTPTLQTAGSWVRQMADLEVDEGGQFAFRRLELALDALRRWPQPQPGLVDAAPMPDTAFWDHCENAISAATSVEARLQHRVTGLLRGLDQHWQRFNYLILGCLVLGLTTVGLLRLVRQRRRQLSHFREESSRRASRDALTGLWNRDAILKLLREELSRSARNDTPVGLALADIDNFTETHLLLGDQEGDFILEQMSARMQAHMRPYDSLGRLEGHTFLVLLPTCDPSATRMVAERLQEALNQHDVEHAMGRIRITTSLVYTTITAETKNADAHLLVHRMQESLVEVRCGGEKGQLLGLDERAG